MAGQGPGFLVQTSHASQARMQAQSGTAEKRQLNTYLIAESFQGEPQQQAGYDNPTMEMVGTRGPGCPPMNYQTHCDAIPPLPSCPRDGVTQWSRSEDPTRRIPP